METVLSRIAQASYTELEQIMRAVENRFSVAFPDWEVIYVSVHKDPKLRKEEVARLLEFIERTDA